MRKDGDLQRALARWESEGGRATPEIEAAGIRRGLNESLPSPPRHLRTKKMTRKADRETPGVSTRDIFGEATGTSPATPGSYGQTPAGFRLPSATGLGPVRLQIADLSRSLDYYQRVLGLQVLQQTGSSARLGTLQGTGLVELTERRGLRPLPGQGRTGLFHFAILLPDRAFLGRFALYLEQLGVAAGASDHLVSEALYLRDPDNLGIEVYTDRPRTAWRRTGRELMMATDPIDMDGLLEAAV
ncbi:MAG: VOC family protein, partial [Thermoanaerobaculia bacterium]|nr:VOC family protein [Thermoanaerobaculia bacterium]